jgi:uncharacterized repeat protein (TIGR01451 family)
LGAIPWLAFALVAATGSSADDVDAVIGSLPPGKSVTIRFGARVASPVAAGATQLSYQGTVSGTNFPSQPTDDPDTGAPGDVTLTPLNVADLRVAKSGAPATVFAGGTVTYTITVTNAGPRAAANASLVDVLPAETTFQSLSAPAGWTCLTPAVGAGGTVSCAHASLPVSTGVFTLVVGVGTNVLGGTTIVNTAAVASATPDQSPGDEAASSAVSVAASADLAITKTGPAAVFPGSTVTYEVTVHNLGPDAAASVSVTDPTPPGLVFVGNAGDCGTAFPCAFPSLPAGATRTITATFRVPADYPGPDPIVNAAAVASATPDPRTTNDTATAQTFVNLPAYGLSFHTLSPCRLLDTRDAPGPLGGPALQASQVRLFPLLGVCGIPATAKALSVNVTVTQGTTYGHVLIFSSGPPAPVVSSTTNYAPGQTRGNNAIVAVNRDVDLSVIVAQTSGAVHFILDVNGYFE